MQVTEQALIIPFFFSLTKATVEPVRGEPVRKMGGFLTTARKDREGQRVLAALKKGAINFEPYLQYGVWNDNHFRKINALKAQITVGYPLNIDFKNGRGFYTEGYFIPDTDEEDESKKGLSVQRANYFWTLAKALEKMKSYYSRALGLSAEGNKELESQDGKDILKATIYNAAVAEVPMNPDCELSIIKSFFDLALPSDLNTSSGRDGINKSLGTSDSAPMIRQDIEGAARNSDQLNLDQKNVEDLSPQEKMQLLIDMMKQRNPELSETKIKQLLKNYLKKAEKIRSIANA